MIKNTRANILYDTEKDIYNIKLQAPLSVCWQITTKCNLNCKYCLSSSGSQGCAGLETKKALKIINDLGKAGINRLDFTGGEPLLRKDLDILIDEAKKNNISTIVTTNTLLLNDNNIKTLMKADLVQISIDGDREEHNRQRQSESFDKTIENIEKLKKLGCKIRLNSFIYNNNKKHLDYLLNLTNDLDLFSHLFIMFTPQGRGKENEDQIINKEESIIIKNKIKSYRVKNKKNIRLYDYREYLHSCVLIDPMGNVISQGFYEKDSIKVGNLFDKSIEELFNNDIFDHPMHVLHYLQKGGKE